MAATEDWLRTVAGDIAAAEACLPPADRRRLKLPLLLRSARRVAAYSEECATCRALQGHIADVAAYLAAPGRALRRQPMWTEEIARHLARSHRLVGEKYYVKRLVIMGVAFGASTVALGLVLVNFGITLLTLGVTLPALATRVVFSYTAGWWLDRRARRRDRVL